MNSLLCWQPTFRPLARVQLKKAVKEAREAGASHGLMAKTTDYSRARIAEIATEWAVALGTATLAFATFVLARRARDEAEAVRAEAASVERQVALQRRRQGQVADTVLGGHAGHFNVTDIQWMMRPDGSVPEGDDAYPYRRGLVNGAACSRVPLFPRQSLCSCQDGSSVSWPAELLCEEEARL